MKPKIKKLWLEALTSGKYRQGRGALRTTKGGFCCLGVLCDLHDKSRKRKTSNWGAEGKYLGKGGVLPYEVKEWAGLDSQNPVIGNFSLAGRNDDVGGQPRQTFKKIAKLIEANL